jgi:hypothetical protein
LERPYPGYYSTGAFFPILQVATISGETMAQPKEKLTVHGPATYRIRVQGVLDENWSEYYGGMTIQAKIEPDQPPVTTLTGQLLDQAALMGVLNRLYGLCLPFLSVECLSID